METPRRQKPDAWPGAVRHWPGRDIDTNTDARPRQPQAPGAGQLIAERLGRLDLTMISGSRQEMARTWHIERDDAQALLLILQLEGSCRIEQDERTVRLVPGDMALLDWARPSRVCFEHDFRVLVLCLARASVHAWLGGRSLPPAMRLEGQSGVGALLGSYLRALGEQAGRLDPTSAAVAVEHVVAMLGLAFGRPPVPPDDEPPWPQVARLRPIQGYVEMEDVRLAA